MFKITSLIIIFSFLSACSSHYKLALKRCKSDLVIGKLNKFKGEPFFIKHSFFQFPFLTDTKNINIRSILSENKIKCEQVKAIRIKSIDSWDQAVIDLLPGISSHTLLIEGVKKPL